MYGENTQHGYLRHGKTCVTLCAENRTDKCTLKNVIRHPKVRAYFTPYKPQTSLPKLSALNNTTPTLNHTDLVQQFYSFRVQNSW